MTYIPSSIFYKEFFKFLPPQNSFYNERTLAVLLTRWNGSARNEMLQVAVPSCTSMRITFHPDTEMFLLGVSVSTTPYSRIKVDGLKEREEIPVKSLESQYTIPPLSAYPVSTENPYELEITNVRLINVTAELYFFFVTVEPPELREEVKKYCQKPLKRPLKVTLLPIYWYECRNYRKFRLRCIRCRWKGYAFLNDCFAGKKCENSEIKQIKVNVNI